MNQIRLIAMDMDGTLLCGLPCYMPEENRLALKAAEEKGIHLALCSGRLPDDAACFAYDAGIDMSVLALNGACRMDHAFGDITYVSTLDPGDVLRLVDLAQRSGAVIGVFSGNDLVTNEKDDSPSDPAVRWGTNIFRKEGRCTIRRELRGLDELLKKGVAKAVIIDESEHPDLTAIRETAQNEMPHLEISSSWVNNIEVNRRGCDKGTAIREYAAHLGLTMDQVMAIGDNDNDVPMLEAAGFGVCMGNSTPAAVEAAGYLTLRNDFNGVAAAIRRLALGEDVKGVRRLTNLTED